MHRCLKNVCSFTDAITCDGTGLQILLMYRSIPDETGGVLGTVAAIVDLSYYERLFSGMDVGEKGMVSVRRTDTSRLVVRWPVESDRLNNEAPDIPPQQAVAEGNRKGVVRYVGATDGVDRIFAYRRVEGFPFYVLVGRGYSDQFSLWRIISSVAAGVALLMILLTVLLVRRLNRETAELSAADALVRRMLEDKEKLIQELLHRTNNSLQVVRSLVQLELMGASGASGASGKTDSKCGEGLSRLSRLDTRVRILSLVQQSLNHRANYFLIPLGTFLEDLRNELGGLFPFLLDAEINVPSADLLVVLDAVAPVGLVIGELVQTAAAAADAVSHPEVTQGVAERTDRIVLDVSVSAAGDEEEGTIEVRYRDGYRRDLSQDTRSYISALVEHQLMGELTWDNCAGTCCLIRFSTALYIPRVPA
jgi:two-component sensor histidine kinase